MQKFIKVFAESCKNYFIKWIFDNILIQNLVNVAIIMPTLAFIQSIPSFYWIPITFVTLLLFILVIIAITHLLNSFQKPALTVDYDDGKYNGIEMIKTYDRGTDLFENMLALRIKVCNNSRKLITGVEILIEKKTAGFSTPPSRGYFTKFNNTKDKVYNCDIYPRSCEIVTLDYFRGNFNEKNEPIELIIKCRGKEIPEITKIIIL